MAKKRELDIVPKPAQLARKPGEFVLNAETKILVQAGVPAIRLVGELLAAKLSPATGFALPVVETPKTNAQRGAILLTTACAGAELGDEGYELDVAKSAVVLRAFAPAGLARGIQTIRQMLPPEIEKLDKPIGPAANAATTASLPTLEPSGPAKWAIPCARIEDRPRFAWRGLMLDCGRMFFNVQFIKRLIDALAYYKMNVFRWHLTEDQGWRIEIKKYPRLTEFGAWRGPNARKAGGFYTQEQIKQVVAYAADRHVTVVPEIEMPGHALAALACFPELSCAGGPFGVETTWGIAPDVFCAGNDKVFTFLEDVLSEVLELFPSPYIHVGADECHKDRWKACPKCQARIKTEGLKDEFELQRYFIERMARFLNQKGRKVIGWDEIMEGDPSTESVIVQAWRWRFDPARAAAQRGYRVINSTSHRNYLNTDVHSFDLRDVYGFDVAPSGLTPQEAARILGGEMCLWTEYVSQRWVDGQIFPRVLGAAENLWSPAEGKDFDAFYRRAVASCERLRRMGVRYGPAFVAGAEPAAR